MSGKEYGIQQRPTGSTSEEHWTRFWLNGTPFLSSSLELAEDEANFQRQVSDSYEYRVITRTVSDWKVK